MSNELAESKKPYLSKTLYASLIVAVAAFYPPVGEWITGNPQIFSMLLGSLFAALRLVTKGKVSIS